MKQDTVLTRLVIGLIFLVMIAYIALSGIKTLTNPHQMVIVYADVAENSIYVDGWIFREEICLEPAYGLINYSLDEGEKSAGGQVVAVSYQNEQALTRQRRTDTLRAQIAQLSYAISDESLSGKNLDAQLISTYTQLQHSAAGGDYSQVAQKTGEYKKLVLRREFLYTEGAQSELWLASGFLGTELESLQSYSGADAATVLAPEAGVFSSYVDGYEVALNPDNLTEDLSVAEFRALVAWPPKPDNGSIGKIVTSNVWYMAMVVSEEERQQFGAVSQVFVRFSSLAEAVPMRVSQIGYVQDGQAVVVLSSRQNLADTITLRDQAATVIFQSEEGLRVPQNALRERDGVIGVYAVTGSQAEFKPVKVVAEGKGFYIVKAEPSSSTDKRILRSGDEVIITTAELYEGKVVR